MAPAVLAETEINIRARSPEAIASVVQELDRQKAVKEDFLVPAHNIQFSVAGDSVVADVKLSDGAWVPPVRYELSRTAHTGIAAKFDVSARYARRMRAVAPDLLVTNLNYWASRDPRRFMVRVLDGRVRAFLSDRYRVVDSSLLFYHGYEKIKAMNGSIIGLAPHRGLILYEDDNWRVGGENRARQGADARAKSQRCSWQPLRWR
jgi:hypothetical protein